jgi:nucleotide-binding universal stress UspA family protein
MRPSKLLVPIDGSARSSEVIEYALDLARAVGAAITFIHVAEITTPRSSLRPSLESERAALEASRRAGESILAQAVQMAGDLGVQTVLRFGDPADEICTEARSRASDLIVIGSRGLGRIDRVLLGSVSEKVTKRAPCPVLVVRSVNHTGAK